MIFKSGRKASPLTSLLDVILLVLFAQNIVYSHLSEVKVKEETKSEIKKYEENYNKLKNEYNESKIELESKANEIKENNDYLKESLEKKEKDLDNKNIELASATNEISILEKQLEEAKSELHKYDVVMKDSEEQIKTLTEFIEKHKLIGDGKEFNAFEIVKSVKALEELSTKIKFVEVRLEKARIEIKIKEKVDYVDWPYEVETRIENFTESCLKKTGELIRKKIMKLSENSDLQILLMWSYDEINGVSSAQIAFFEEMIRYKHIKDIDSIKNVYDCRIGHYTKEK